MADETRHATLDDAHGGLAAVLSKELARYGLPKEAGLTGLLQHLEGNHGLTLAFERENVRMLRFRIEQVEALCRAATETASAEDAVLPVTSVQAAILRSSANTPARDDEA